MDSKSCPTNHSQHGDDSIAVRIACFALVIVASIICKIRPELPVNNLLGNLPLLGFFGGLIVEVALLKQSM